MGIETEERLESWNNFFSVLKRFLDIKPVFQMWMTEVYNPKIVDIEKKEHFHNKYFSPHPRKFAVP